LDKQFEFIEKSLKVHMDFIGPEIFKNRRVAWMFRIAAIILGSLVTIILGFTNITWGKNVALVLSGLLAALTIVESLFSFHSKSVQQNNYYRQLIHWRMR
jgi:hypothetical protein